MISLLVPGQQETQVVVHRAGLDIGQWEDIAYTLPPLTYYRVQLEAQPTPSALFSFVALDDVSVGLCSSAGEGFRFTIVLILA